MIVDTSIFIDFLRKGDASLARALEDGRVLSHPFVIGEIALGSLKNRAEIIGLLSALPKATVATDEEVMAYIERFSLFGRGVGYVDAHLLASARLTGERLWTRDRRLRAVAEDLSLASEQS